MIRHSDNVNLDPVTGTRGPQLGPRAQRQADFEASLAPGTCRICKYANAARDTRCYQCGNML